MPTEEIVDLVASIIAAATGLMLFAERFRSWLARIWYLLFPCTAGPILKRLLADVEHFQQQLRKNIEDGLGGEDRKKLVNDLKKLQIYPPALISDSRQMHAQQLNELEYLRRTFKSWRFLKLARRRFYYRSRPGALDFDADRINLWTEKNWRIGMRMR